jgi:hypothetical protein
MCRVRPGWRDQHLDLSDQCIAGSGAIARRDAAGGTPLSSPSVRMPCCCAPTDLIPTDVAMLLFVDVAGDVDLDIIAGSTS